MKKLVKEQDIIKSGCDAILNGAIDDQKRLDKLYKAGKIDKLGRLI